MFDNGNGDWVIKIGANPGGNVLVEGEEAGRLHAGLAAGLHSEAGSLRLVVSQFHGSIPPPCGL
jgi:hypothetical protein